MKTCSGGVFRKGGKEAGNLLGTELHISVYVLPDQPVLRKPALLNTCVQKDFVGFLVCKSRGDSLVVTVKMLYFLLIKWAVTRRSAEEKNSIFNDGNDGPLSSLHEVKYQMHW